MRKPRPKKEPQPFAPVKLPIEMYDGPARIFHIMEGSKTYTTDEIAKLSGLVKTTAHRHLNRLVEVGAVDRFNANNGKGRPVATYWLRDTNNTPPRIA